MTTPFWTIFCAPHKRAIERYPHRTLPYYYECPLCEGRHPLMAVNDSRAIEFFHRKKHFAVLTKNVSALKGLKALGFRLEPQVLEVEA